MREGAELSVQFFCIRKLIRNYSFQRTNFANFSGWKRNHRNEPTNLKKFN